MSYKGRYQAGKAQKPEKPQKQPKSKGSKGGKIALIVLIVVIALLVAAIGAGVFYYNHLLGKITTVEADPTNVNYEVLNELPPAESTEETIEETTEATEPPKVYAPDDIVNIMLVGNSSRPGEDSRLADTSILVTINKYTKTVYLNSVFRDTLVKFPTFVDASGTKRNGGQIKFTTCYHLGWKFGNYDVAWAMDVQNMTMKENFGVEVDYNFEVDFKGFMALINKIGGVPVTLTQAEADYLNKDLDNYLKAEEGEEWLDGYAALSYVRMRHAKGDSDSDLKRTSRQRYFLERLFNQIKDQDLATLTAAVSEVMPYITTNMPKEEINKLLMDLVPMLPDLKIVSGTIPVEVDGKKYYWGELYDIYKDGQQHSIIRFDPKKNKEVIMAITGDAVAATEAAN